MKKLIKKLYSNWFKVTSVWCNVYVGIGFLQGTGFSILVKRLYIGTWFTFVTDIKIKVNAEWLRTLKRNIELDEEQQNIEKSRL